MNDKIIPNVSFKKYKKPIYGAKYAVNTRTKYGKRTFAFYTYKKAMKFYKLIRAEGFNIVVYTERPSFPEGVDLEY